MDNRITITPSVLTWARTTSGYCEEQVVKHLGDKRVTLDIFMGWESGAGEPTYPQLKKLARFYKRPVALFFFPEPPEETSIKEDFRVLPSSIVENIPSNILYLVRKAKARQIDLEELHGRIADKAKITTLKSGQQENATDLAKRIRGEMGVSIQNKTTWKDFDIAFKYWRSAVESLGVWVFKEAFGNDDYCGFCVDDDKFPVIYVNNSQAPQRQIFTLFHELGHLLTDKAGVDFRSVLVLKGAYQDEEAFCNAFAVSFLVPDNDFSRYISLPDDEAIKNLAHKYKVSFEVILRKFLDKRIIDSETYNSMVMDQKEKFNLAQLEGIGGEKGGGDYYLTQRVYLGDKYIRLAFEQYYRQGIDKQQLAECLGVKIKSLPALEDAFMCYRHE